MGSNYVTLHRWKIVLVCTIFLFLLSLVFSFSSIVIAADFDTEIDITYTVDPSGVMHIREIRKIKNNSQNFYIPENSTEQFIISTFKVRSDSSEEDLEKVKKTINLFDATGTSLSYDSYIEGRDIVVKASFGENIMQGSQKTFILEYDNFELVEKVGNVWNIYLPGLPKDYDQEKTSNLEATNKADYKIALKVDDKLGTPSFVLPKEKLMDNEGGFTTYTFDPKNLVDQAAWIQIGDVQYYNFEITQNVVSSDELAARVFNVFYDLILPRESDLGTQRVYFNAFNPEPLYVKKDEEGNISARFVFSSNENTEITVTGTLVSSNGQKISKEMTGDIKDIDLSNTYAELEGTTYTYNDLLSSVEYWEVDAPEIQSKALELKGDLTNVYEIIHEDYEFVTQSVDYDNLKTGLKNQRNGALATLNGGSSVCMEYSDLLVTLLRAQGIPARAAFGYGFDPKSEEATDEGHQWVEVYLPNIGWVPVDPTWGDTGKRNYIGSDLDHALWRVASIDVDTPSPVTKFSIDNNELEAPLFRIKPVDSISIADMLELSEVIDKYEYTPKHYVLEKISQLNVYGKILFIVFPIILLVALFIIFLKNIARFQRRKSSTNYVQAKPASHEIPANPYY